MKPPRDSSALVAEFWGADVPDWVAVLAAECQRSSQTAVAKRLEVSLTMVNQTLRQKYPGDLRRIEDLVRGHYMAAVMDCPAKGQIAANVCRMWRDRSQHFVPVNHERVLMFRACQSCGLFRKEDPK